MMLVKWGKQYGSQNLLGRGLYSASLKTILKSYWWIICLPTYWPNVNPNFWCWEENHSCHETLCQSNGGLPKHKKGFNNGISNVSKVP